MESVPPSYEEATNKDYLGLIAPHLRGRDLCSASVVCKHWNSAFTPWLWGRPASHFGLEDDRVYVALTKFRRVLPRVRLQVREWTHTLHLPPAHPELYGNPHTKWLRDILLSLPNLQSLIVSSLPSFDHAALSALRYDFPKTEVPKGPSMFPLRLLIAPKCTNTTSRGLETALSFWPNLVFLDLSDTPAARDTSVLSRLKTLLSLQVVKLRHVDLRDQDLEVLADAISTRVRSLDLRDNSLTDASTRKLLNTCFHTQGDGSGSLGAVRAYRRSFEGLSEDRWSLAAQRPLDTLLDEFRGEDLDQRFIKRLTNGSITRLPSEDLPPTGITHLYLANNLFTIEGVASLLRTKNLCFLDVGEIDTMRALSRSGTKSFFTRPQEKYPTLPGVEKLAPILQKYCAENLTYLRIHHQLVTRPAPPKMEMPGSLPTTSTVALNPITTEAPAYEVGDAAPIYEMGVGDLTLESGSNAIIDQGHERTRRKSLGNDRGLLPEALPKLKILVLTNVPCTSNERKVINALKGFIGDCADEHRLANIRTQFERSTLHLPGHARSGRHWNRPEQLFALREIILEMASSQEAATISPCSPSGPAAAKSSTMRDWSSTEDPDTEALWVAAENDFSFFEDELGRLPDEKPRLHHALSTVAEKMPLPADSTPADPQPLSPVSSKSTVIIDTIQELAAFRRERKTAFELARKGGELFVEGYWPGEVKVIRHSTGQKGFVNDYSPFLR